MPRIDGGPNFYKLMVGLRGLEPPTPALRPAAHLHPSVPWKAESVHTPAIKSPNRSPSMQPPTLRLTLRSIVVLEWQFPVWLPRMI